MIYDTACFVGNLQEILIQPLCLDNQDYLDLSIIKEINEEILHEKANHLPLPDPLIKAMGLILQTMEKGPFELTSFGVNELFKSFLLRIKKENEVSCTRCYFDCIYQLYLFSLLDTYPYTELFWEFLSQCLDTVSKYIIEYKLIKSCQVFLNKVSIMGKCAAQKGLHTSSIQNLLHNMELWAREEGALELADNAMNQRFNLEIF